MSLEELYNAIKGDSKLSDEFEAACDAGTVEAFAKAHGCSASEDEIAAYIASK